MSSSNLRASFFPGRWLVTALAVALLAAHGPDLSAQANAGDALYEYRVSGIAGGFTGVIDDSDLFGQSVASIGDVDGDGVTDLAVGSLWDDDGGPDRGAVWILFLNGSGTVKGHTKISSTAGGFTGALDDGDQFGASVARIGDLNLDGISDIAVGANLDDDGGPDRGAVWILFLKADGTVNFHRKISSTSAGFTGVLDDSDFFGISVAGVGDLNGDTRPDLAVGSILDDDGGTDRGAVWILFLTPLGGVLSSQKIADGVGGFTGTLDNGDWLGTSLAARDFDGDTLHDLAVGARNDDDGGANRGAVWILYLDATGMVTSQKKISQTAGGFTGTLDDVDRFGASVIPLLDVNGDGNPDLAVGASHDDDGGPNRGALWILFLDANEDVVGHNKLSSTSGALVGAIADGDQFGYAGCVVEGDPFRSSEIAVTARFADEGGIDRGVVTQVQLSGGTFTDIGNAKPGTTGFPSLSGSGDFTFAGTVTLLLTNVPASTTAAYMAGIAPGNLLFKDGVIVPFPFLVYLPGLSTGFVGKIQLQGIIITPIPPGVKIFNQFWVLDPGASFGLSASNGLVMVST